MDEMNFSNGVWRQWRSAPGIVQRFSVAFSIDGAPITAQWAQSRSGADRERDFDLTRTRASCMSGLTG
jgi:hypothetical protein